MQPIIVRPHGLRWAVQENPDTAPAQEYDTCELALVAANQLAAESGREVEVVQRTGDEQLGRADQPDVEDRGPLQHDAGIHERTGGSATGTEMPREPQAGL